MQILEKKMEEDLEPPEEGLVGLLTTSISESAAIFSMGNRIVSSERFPLSSGTLDYLKSYSSNILPSTGMNASPVSSFSEITNITDYILESSRAYAPVSTTGPSTGRGSSLSYGAVDYLKSLSPPSTGIDLNPLIPKSGISNVSDYILQRTKSYMPPSTGLKPNFDVDALYKSSLLMNSQRFTPASTGVEPPPKFNFPLFLGSEKDFFIDRLRLLPEPIFKPDFKLPESEKLYESLLESSKKQYQELLSLSAEKPVDVSLNISKAALKEINEIDFEKIMQESVEKIFKGDFPTFDFGTNKTSLSKPFGFQNLTDYKEQLDFSRRLEEIRRGQEETFENLMKPHVTQEEQYPSRAEKFSVGKWLETPPRSIKIFDSDIKTPLIRLDLVQHEKKPPFHLQYGDEFYTGRHGNEAVDIMGDILKKNMGNLLDEKPQEKRESFFERAVKGLRPNRQ